MPRPPDIVESISLVCSTVFFRNPCIFIWHIYNRLPIHVQASDIHNEIKLAQYFNNLFSFTL